jgi:spore germination protein GerM
MARSAQSFTPRVMLIAAVIVIALGALLAVVSRLSRPAEAPPEPLPEDVSAGESIAPEETTLPAAPEVVAPEALAPQMTLQLFVVDTNGRALVSRVQRVEEPATATEQVRLALERLGAVPNSPLPRGAALREIWVANGIAYLDFTPELREQLDGGSLAELMFVYGIVGTLTSSIPSVGAVQFLINGESIDTINGHTDLNAPVEPISDWNF